LNEQVPGVMEPGDDAFIIDKDGILQTPSRRYGGILGRVPWEVPYYSAQVRTMELPGPGEERLYVGYAHIEQSPFILVMVSRRVDVEQSWNALRRNLALFLGVSVLVIFTVVIWGVSGTVRRIRESDDRRGALLHQVEYTNKMAAIGRLASGVAHEVNNPLAIISEKAGLMDDVLREDFPPSPDTEAPREELLRQIQSILRSVDRCAGITHRLLGFAKHMDVGCEAIDLTHLLREVYGFLERESSYRNIQVEFHPEDDLPQIHSDEGQLQQVFLNLLNNGIAAVSDGGRIDVRIRSLDPEHVMVSIEDNGTGIAQENLPQVFEPFFSTKGGAGTGLGLSITHGIVEKLGGGITVESELGKGSTFSVILPVKRAVSSEQGEQS
jgi:two-component system, NtrC family, sensor kinase